jgi:two-component sensor histidine kinase
MKRNQARSALDDITPQAMTAIAIDGHLPIVEENGLVQVMPYLDVVADALSRALIHGDLRLSLTVNPLCSALPADEVTSIGSRLTELVTTAVRARGAAPQGTIAIALEMAGPDWRLTVSDDGDHNGN